MTTLSESVPTNHNRYMWVWRSIRFSLYTFCLLCGEDASAQDVSQHPWPTQTPTLILTHRQLTAWRPKTGRARGAFGMRNRESGVEGELPLDRPIRGRKSIAFSECGTERAALEGKRPLDRPIRGRESLM